MTVPSRRSSAAPPRRSRGWWIVKLAALCAACVVAGGVASAALFSWRVNAARDEFVSLAAWDVSRYHDVYAAVQRTTRDARETNAPQDYATLEIVSRRLLLTACPALDPKSEYYSAARAQVLLDEYIRARRNYPGVLYTSQAASVFALDDAAARVCEATPTGVLSASRGEALRAARLAILTRGRAECARRHIRAVCSDALTPDWLDSVI